MYCEQTKLSHFVEKVPKLINYLKNVIMYEKYTVIY